jgi:hypothetical protein
VRRTALDPLRTTLSHPSNFALASITLALCGVRSAFGRECIVSADAALALTNRRGRFRRSWVYSSVAEERHHALRLGGAPTSRPVSGKTCRTMVTGECRLATLLTTAELGEGGKGDLATVQRVVRNSDPAGLLDDPPQHMRR